MKLYSIIFRYFSLLLLRCALCVCMVWVSGDSVVSPLAGALNRLYLEPVQEKVEVDRAAAASGQCETEERSILDELRQVQQRWYSSQTPKQQQQQQRVNINTSYRFSFTSYSQFLTNKPHLCG